MRIERRLFCFYFSLFFFFFFALHFNCLIPKSFSRYKNAIKSKWKRNEEKMKWKRNSVKVFVLMVVLLWCFSWAFTKLATGTQLFSFDRRPLSLWLSVLHLFRQSIVVRFVWRVFFSFQLLLLLLLLFFFCWFPCLQHQHNVRKRHDCVTTLRYVAALKPIHTAARQASHQNGID